MALDLVLSLFKINTTNLEIFFVFHVIVVLIFLQ